MLKFQKEFLLESFTAYVCASFGMGRPSEGFVNFAANDMLSSLSYLNEAHEIENEIEDKKSELRALREKFARKKRDISKLFKRSERNFPSDMFEFYRNVMAQAQIHICDAAKLTCPKHKPVLDSENFLDKGKTTAVYRRRTRKYASSEISKICMKRSKLDDLEPWREGLASAGCLKVDETVDEADVEVYPLWSRDRPGEIVISAKNSTKVEVVKVYDPGYSPNPFEQYMRKISVSTLPV